MRPEGAKMECARVHRRKQNGERRQVAIESRPAIYDHQTVTEMESISSLQDRVGYPCQGQERGHQSVSDTQPSGVLRCRQLSV